VSLVLETKRLRLRRFVLEDADEVTRLANNWDVARMLGRMPYPYVIDHAKDFLARIATDTESKTDFVFAFTTGGPIMGAIGLHLRDGGAFELGYWLGEPYWGKGYATEAADRLVQFAFTDLDTEKLTAGHFYDNPASGRVLRKVGFRYTGDGFRECLARGGKVLCHEMDMLREDWRARRTHSGSSASIPA
jgi:[ribosomal protein S5]-alanine N-acetyltransferase